MRISDWSSDVCSSDLPAQVKDILERTATNMTGRTYWEAGAGHVNAYEAVAEAAGLRTDHGATVNSLREFNSNALLVKGADPIPFSVDLDRKSTRLNSSH